ncbi:hypothetical protein Ocin01_07889 [Orchesella cincta]|uniref:Uncharacterized protein n=1 Tax=Orchesella cincta TaxID=48709 RepID=A0A1D2N0S1_ORCCI|nr:hypothetical protein Ocin01_07889 [Orchesella cincta]
MKPPSYLLTTESPTQTIKIAIEESTQLFLDAVRHATCGSRRISFSRRSHTKAIIVVEDNNEVLELLTAALWFFEKTPLATFQAKYCHNREDFLLTLDACRLYFGTYPAYLARKDERIFERWLGVGMNDVLRSHNSKILLIDFPRPGMLLQRSKDILINRLKMEEKLHNIKSFMVSKPTRKEDNLSTVENLLDEIQKCLEPRDKLLFRKARRMYLDLKLYKQIEQKSRQDVKSLKEWGLPEPENEHDLWERLRNSQIVLNGPIPPLELVCLPDIQETSAISITSLDSNCIENFMSNADAVLSETDTSSLNPNSIAEIHSDEDSATLLDVTVARNLEMETLEDDVEEYSNNDNSRYDAVEEVYEDDYIDYNSMIQNLADRISCTNSIINNDGSSTITSHNRNYQDVELDENLLELESYTHDDSAEAVERIILGSITDLPSFDETIPNEEEQNSNGFHNSCDSLLLEEASSGRTCENFSLSATNVTDNRRNQSLSAASTEEHLNGTLQRSLGFLDLHDDDLLTESVHFTPRYRSHKTSNIMNVTDDELDEEHTAKPYTRIEFTLAPKVTSGESSSRSSISIQKVVKLNKTFDKESLTNSETQIGVNETQSETLQQTKNKPTHKRSLHETCVAHFSKWGKSFTRLLRKRRVFPEAKFQSHHTSRVKVNSSTDGDEKQEDFVEMEMNSSVKSSNVSDNSTVGLMNDTRSNENSTSWLSTVRRYLQLRTGKSSRSGKVFHKLKRCRKS